jgi:hypothetical protein
MQTFLEYYTARKCLTNLQLEMHKFDLRKHPEDIHVLQITDPQDTSHIHGILVKHWMDLLGDPLLARSRADLMMVPDHVELADAEKQPIVAGKHPSGGRATTPTSFVANPNAPGAQEFGDPKYR